MRFGAANMADKMEVIVCDKNNEIGGCDTTQIDPSCGRRRRIMADASKGSLGVAIDRYIANLAPEVIHIASNLSLLSRKGAHGTSIVFFFYFESAWLLKK